MLKYKRKRVLRYSIAVIVPIFILTAATLLLFQSKNLDISDIDLASTTRELFSEGDTLVGNHDKMSATNDLSATPRADDTSKTENTTDSTAASTLPIDHFEGKSIAEYINTDTIALKKDVLIAVKHYVIPVDLHEKKTDSLLMNRSNSSSPLQFTIEFWQSPVNFKGYKLSANKAIIFGISDIENCELYIDNQQYYLIINNQLFLLETTDIFKKLTELTH